MDKLQKNIPNHWKWVKLENVSKKITDGSHNPPKGIENGVPMLSAKNIQNNSIDFSDVRYLSEDDFEIENRRTSLETLDILLTTVGTIGRVALVPNNSKFVLQRSVTVVKPLINPKYLLYFFQSNDFQKKLNENATGTAQKGIYLNVLKQLDIPLAPIEEQNRIVEKIEELFSNIDESTRQINSALEKAKSYIKKTIYKQFKGNLLQDNEFNELPSTWKWKKLFEIGSVYSGGTPSTKKNEYWGGDISWITPADLSNYNEVYISDGKRFISQLGLDKSSAKLLPKGTILFSTRAPIGYVVIAKNEIATNQGFKNIVINAGIDKLYVYYYLKSITDYAKKIASGTTFLELSTNKFREIPIPIAPINEQINIVNTIENAIIYSNKLSDELNNEKKKIECIKQKILQDAYLGRITEQYMSDSSVESLLLEISKLKEEYIKNQIEIKKNKPKFIKMAKEKLSIIEVLKKYNEPISAENLWQESEHEKIDDFYEKLKEVEHLVIQDISKRPVKISLK